MRDTARIADDALRGWYESNDNPALEKLNWNHYRELIDTITGSIGGGPAASKFLYEHPESLQDLKFGLRKPYSVWTDYSDPGTEGAPLIAVGGLTNVKQRFDFLTLDTYPELRVLALNMAGRGESGWLVELTDYHLDAYVEQLKQFLDHLGLESCSLLGSSLGGSAIIKFAANFPERVRSLVLNDSSPFIPTERRARRAVAVARHYVFQSPAQMFRRTGAAAKYSGPSLDAVLLHNAHHKTRWSDAEMGRVYRHDLRALLAYRAESTANLDLWQDWQHVQCPVLLIHGELSDAVQTNTIDKMRSTHDAFSVIHLAGTGHTPSLSDGALNQRISDWIRSDTNFENDQHHQTNYQPTKVLYTTQ